MKKKHLFNRMLSLALAAMLCLGFAAPIGSAAPPPEESAGALQEIEAPAFSQFSDQFLVGDEEESAPYEDDEMVRVSIVLKKESTLEMANAAGISTLNLSGNAVTVRYRQQIRADQQTMADKISVEILDGAALDVVWNLTLAANLISANIPYGKLDEIAAMPGVESVVIETLYQPMVLETVEDADPNMSTSGSQIGSNLAWAAGYTGAGSRIAIIDTGIDPDHQSFDAGAFEHSLSLLGEDYDLLDAEEIASVYDQLNISGIATQADLYVSSKVPFGYNYVDLNHVIDHDHDAQGGHGSHVAGIAAANSYLPDGEGGYVASADSVLMQGVAPDAQLLVMKVFGNNGGAYDSDYMAAIEDALLLGADTINLSLGSGAAGFTRIDTAAYADIFAQLAETDTVVTISAGNNYAWADSTVPGALFSDDVNFHTGGSPGTYTNSLGIASVDNAGFTDRYLQVDDHRFAYVESAEYGNAPLSTVAGEQEFILFTNIGVDYEGQWVEYWDDYYEDYVQDYVEVPVNLLAPYADVTEGKVVLVSRGTSSFVEKHQAAEEVGALACIVYNNTSGLLGLDLTGTTAAIPCVAITQENAQIMLDKAEAVTDEDGNILYYTGTIYVSEQIGSVITSDGSYIMSDFSSWGVPGSLEMKPELTAPGGDINSVEGTEEDEQEYVVMSGTSMAAPQVAGMGALLAQHLKETGLAEQEGLSLRTLAQSLLMSTAVPLYDDANGGSYYPVLQQGAGLANVGNAVTAQSYILMNPDATDSYADGKVKVELGDDPDRVGEYSFSFTVNNMGEEESRFTMSADLFTQDLFDEDGSTFLAAWTTALLANATFVAGGETLEFYSLVDADVDQDGDTDIQDAQGILDYIVGINDGSALDLTVADADGDGDVDSYDAYLIVSGFTSSSFEVPAYGSVEVQVTLKLTDSTKEYLNANYPVGAYIEGFVHVKSVATDEGLVDVDHSIPVLGYYGNWSDASMYDRVDYVEYAYDEDPYDLDSYTYLGSDYANSLEVKFAGDKNTYYYAINPYMIEDEIPYDRGALRSDSTIKQFKVALTRNAAAVAGFAMVDGEVVYLSGVTNRFAGAYYRANVDAWYNTSATLYMSKAISAFGAEEGDEITIGVVAVPEYYENGGSIDEAQLTELLESGVLGEGAYYAYTFVVDNTAPEVLECVKDEETGALTITLQDNNYVAAVAVLNKSGSRQYAVGIPEQSEAGQAVQFVAELGQYKIGETCTIMVADYAGNETYYKYEYNGEAEDYSGRMFGFTNTSVLDSGSRWVEVDPDTLYHDNLYTYTHDGMATMGKTDLGDISAAEYVDGYVYFATRGDKAIYAAEQGDWAAYQKVAAYEAMLKDYGGVDEYGDPLELYIAEMAYNYADGQLYVMDNYNNIYTMDLLSGQLTFQYHVQIHHPQDYTEYGYYGTTAYENTYLVLRQLAVDEEGNFYSVNNHSSGNSLFLFRWTNEDAVDGVVELNPAVGTLDEESGEMVYTSLMDYDRVNYSHSYLQNVGTGSMAWDTETDTLYMATSYTSNWTTEYNRLMVINTETGRAEYPNELPADSELANEPIYDWVWDEDYNESYEQIGVWGDFYNDFCGRFRDQVVALYIVPGEGVGSGVGAAESASKVELSKTSLELMQGAGCTLSAEVYPWTLEDKSVTWSSSDESIVTVDAYGDVKAVGVGEATVTAASSVSPEVTASCTVTVTAVPNIEFSALLYDENSISHWIEVGTDGLTEWDSVSDAGYYYAGTLHNGRLIVHDGTAVYAVDPDTFMIEGLFQMDQYWYWSDAASYTALGAEDSPALLGISNNGTYLIMLDVEGQSLSYINTYSYFGSDPLALIAYKDSEPYEYYGDYYPANNYYVLSESGYLYTMTMYYDEYYGYTSTNVSYVGSTGLDLSGIPAVDAGCNGSMIYDQASGLILVAAYVEGTASQVYVIDPAAEDLYPANVGTFGEEIWPVVALYQYDRATDLTIRLNTTSASLYVGDQKQIDYRVILGETNGATFASSDKAVATVDENGLITAVGEGSATITITTVDVNDAGEQIQAQVEVTVQALLSVEGQVNAQIVVDGQAQWVTIDLSDMSYVVNADSEFALQGGGMAKDYIYGSDANASTGVGGYSYRIDPETFTEEVGEVWPAQLAILGVADAPAAEVTFDDSFWYCYDGEMFCTGEAFGYSVVLTSAQMLLFQDFATDFTESVITGYVDCSYDYDDLGAIVYQGSVPAEEWEYYLCDAGNTVHYYLILGGDGTLYQMMLYPVVTESDEFWDTWSPEDLIFTCQPVIGEVADLGIKFADHTKLSMALTADGTGLIISDRSGGQCSLYYVDLSDEYNITCGKIGTLQDVESITALYTAEAPAAAVTGIPVDEMVSVEFNSCTDINEVMNSVSSEPVSDTMAQVDSIYTGKNSASAGGELHALKTANVYGGFTTRLKIIADEDVTNGLYTVSYDSELLEVVSVVVDADYKAVNLSAPGQVKLAFADVDGISAGSTVATVTFSVKMEALSLVSVVTNQMNEDHPDTLESVWMGVSPTVIPSEPETPVEPDTDTETTTNPDGSTTTTTTDNSTGTVTEVTENTDGSTVIVETKTDGTVTTTETTAENVTVETVVQPEEDTTVEITVPAEVESVTVTVPVEATSGMVAINAETGEVVKYSVPTEDGLAILVDESVSLIIVDNSMEFEDAEDHWAENAIDFVTARELYFGVSSTEFAPNSTMTRAMLMTVLARLDDQDTTGGEIWYEKGMEWAVEMGISDGTYPTENINREQVVAMLYRYAKLIGADISSSGDLSSFTDGDQTSSWAQEAMEWAVSNGIVSGYPSGVLIPDGKATRAEVAIMLQRFVALLTK